MCMEVEGQERDSLADEEEMNVTDIKRRLSGVSSSSFQGKNTVSLKTGNIRFLTTPPRLMRKWSRNGTDE